MPTSDPPGQPCAHEQCGERPRALCGVQGGEWHWVEPDAVGSRLARLFEHGVYDDAGQLVTGSLMDYCMPRADNLPSFRTEETNLPCPHNPLGMKGCGEAGAIGSPAAMLNAVVDAIGVDIDMPATPEKVWRALQSRAQAAE